MRRIARILLVLVLALSVLSVTACAQPTATPTAGPTATPTTDTAALFLADAVAAQKTTEHALFVYLDLVEQIEDVWYDAASQGKDGLAAAQAFVATDSVKAIIASYQADLDLIDQKAAAWKGMTVPDSAKEIPGLVATLIAKLKALKPYLTAPSGTMYSYETAAEGTDYRAAKDAYDALLAAVAALG